ncbi:MAG: ATP-binding protein [Planctomycetes bacterium]|nr:ATP-binding protein [Planctomycetota bacterium]
MLRRPGPEGWSRGSKAAAVAGLVGAITLLHVLSPMPHGHRMDLHALHTVLEGLYYLPILMAGFAFGLRGGLACGVLVDMVYALHTHLQLGGLADPANRGRLLALLIFPTIGAVTGWLTDALRRETRAHLAAERQLQRAELLAALGELSAGLAHEIRNPLAAIRGAAEVVTGAVPKDSKDFEFATLLQSEVDRLDRVLSDFLLFARPGPAGEEHADPAACARATFALLAAQAGRAGVDFRLTEDGPPTLVRCPPSSLRQVLLNLVLNSLQAIREKGGEVLVRIGPDRRGAARITVDDTGPGVPPGHREKLFRPFFSTKPGGTGLGLSLAAKIVEGCGGSITVGDAPGGGARFAFTLPRAPDGARPPEPEVVG